MFSLIDGFHGAQVIMFLQALFLFTKMIIAVQSSFHDPKNYSSIAPLKQVLRAETLHLIIISLNISTRLPQFTLIRPYLVQKIKQILANHALK